MQALQPVSSPFNTFWGKQMLITALPSDLFRYEIFSYFNSVELGVMGLVCKQFYVHARQEHLWKLVPQKLRFRIDGIIPQKEWEEEGVRSIEDRMIAFIRERVATGKVSHLEVAFASRPGAKLSLWVGDGVLPALDTAPDERWVVFGGTVQNQTVCFFRPEDHATYFELFKKNGKKPCQTDRNGCCEIAHETRTELSAYRDVAAIFPKVFNRSLAEILPPRWFRIEHQNVSHWRFTGWYEGSAVKVARAAEARIYELDMDTVRAYASEQKLL